MEELVKDKIVEWATRYAMNVTNTLMRNFWTNIILLFDLEVAQYMHDNERARNKCVCHFVQII